MENTVCFELEVPPSHTASQQRADMVSILEMFNQVARKAGDYYDAERDILREENLVWVLLNWDVEVSRYPTAGERCVVKTIAHTMDRFVAYREFFVLEPLGKILARGKSRWILLNLELRKPVAAKPYMWELYGVKERSIPFEIANPPKVCSPEWLVEVSPAEKDFDEYGHVHNVSYVRWILDCLEDAIPEPREMERLEILFRKEITDPAPVHVKSQRLFFSPTAAKLGHSILDHHGQVLVNAITHWVFPRGSKGEKAF